MYGGTSDITDDCDCVYILDKLDGYMTGNDVAIEFVNKKARGDVADKVSFSYSKELGQSYDDLVESVSRIDKGKLEELRVNAEIIRELEQDEDIIAAVRSSIDQDITSKAAIVKLVADETGITHNKIRQVLAKRTGKDYALGHRWTVEVGKHNKSTYSILDGA